MPTSYPGALDTSSLPTINAGDSEAAPGKEHDVMHTNANDAIKALQAKVGVDGSTVPTSLDKRVTDVEAAPTWDFVGAIEPTTGFTFPNVSFDLSAKSYDEIMLYALDLECDSNVNGHVYARINNQTNYANYRVHYWTTTTSYVDRNYSTNSSYCYWAYNYAYVGPSYGSHYAVMHLHRGGRNGWGYHGEWTTKQGTGAAYQYGSFSHGSWSNGTSSDGSVDVTTLDVQHSSGGTGTWSGYIVCLARVLPRL